MKIKDLDVSDTSAKQVSLYAFIVAAILGVCVGIPVFEGVGGVWGVILAVGVGIVVFVVSMIGVGWILFWFFAHQTKCPNCQKSFCTKRIGERVINESVVRAKNRNYRVGNKLVVLQCKNCGTQREETIRYKTSV